MSEIAIHHNSAICYNKNDNKIMKEAFPQKVLFWEEYKNI